jgi:hypothetical protein
MPQDASVPYRGGICLAVESQAYVDLGSTLGLSYGVVALYVFILGTVGVYVRAIFRGNTDRIIYTETPEPQDLMAICEGIYIVRLQAYEGHLRDEVRLFETLVKIYRSPQMLMRITGTDIINLPPPREHLKAKTD